MEVDYYFPCLADADQIKYLLKANTRKQSIYFDMADFDPILRKRSNGNEASENLSDNEESSSTRQPFRLRSGTDISDMLSSARLRKTRMKAANIALARPPISRCPSLDLETLTGDVLEEVVVGETNEEIQVFSNHGLEAEE